MCLEAPSSDDKPMMEINISINLNTCLSMLAFTAI